MHFNLFVYRSFWQRIPFTNATEITCSLGENAHVRLEIFNLMRERIVLLTDEDQKPGEFSYTFSRVAAHLNAGIYLVSLRIDGHPFTRRIVTFD